MAKIDRVQDLPEWFDLENYRDCECFDSYEWYLQLLERRSFFNACLERKEPESPTKSAFTWYDDSIEDFRDSPLELPDSLSGIEHRKPPVRSLRDYDLSMAIIEAAFKQGRASDSIDTSVLFKDPHEAGIEIDCIGSQHRLPVLIVDLGVNDSTLKESFAIWLQGARKTHSDLTPKRSKPAWDRWARYGLLPYLDLLIWSMETETHIPDRIMSAAISAYDVGEANLRKTVAPLAEALMDDLSGLQALAAIEAATLAPANPETFED